MHRLTIGTTVTLHSSAQCVLDAMLASHNLVSLPQEITMAQAKSAAPAFAALGSVKCVWGKRSFYVVENGSIEYANEYGDRRGERIPYIWTDITGSSHRVDIILEEGEYTGVPLAHAAKAQFQLF